MTCIYDLRWAGRHGIGRFAHELSLRLPHRPLPLDGRPMSPLDPLRLARQRFGPGDWFLSPGYNGPLTTRVPYVLTVHDMNHVDRPDNSSSAKRLYYRFVLRRICRNARAVLTVSEFSRTRILDEFGLEPERVFSVGNGVSEVFSPAGEKYQASDLYVLCVSNRRGHKNEEGLIKAFARASLPAGTKLVFTGAPDESHYKLASDLGIGNHLVFTGSVSETDLAALYRGALFLVFPSFYEGFGLPIIEAFASGTPVITSNVTSMPEIAGDAALFVNPIDVDDIAQAMSRLASSPDLRTALVERGFQRVPTFTWDMVAQRVRSAIAAVDNDAAHPLSWS